MNIVNKLISLILLYLACHLHALAAEKFDGLIDPDELIAVSSSIPGVLASVNIDKGDHVKKGQIIARLKSGVEQASVDLAKAKYQYNKRRLQRNLELIEKQLISQMDHDDIETEVLVSEMELRQAEEQLALRVIRSPISGIVVERSFSAGEFIQEDSIVKIARLDPLKVRSFFPASRFGSIKKSMQVMIWVPGYDKPFQGEVSLVDPIIDAASETFAVEMKLKNPKYLLPAGLKCKVELL